MAATPSLELPSLGRDAYGAGAREAVRAFYEEYFTLEADVQAKLALVANGKAPEAFKAGFRETLERLAAAVAR